ncbi:MAG: hypothetical protein JHD16_00230 [Solirubrobacteraceae bacterium]|nr:hypothetical protein [Solirubrobacteraceae bacterium]
MRSVGVNLNADEIQTLVAAMAGNHPESLSEHRVSVLRKLAHADSLASNPAVCPSCGDPGYHNVTGEHLCGNAECDYFGDLSKRHEASPDEREVERLRNVEWAARGYVREFDHLVGGEYPERTDLRQALGPIKTEGGAS